LNPGLTRYPSTGRPKAECGKYLWRQILVPGPREALITTVPTPPGPSPVALGGRALRGRACVAGSPGAASPAVLSSVSSIPVRLLMIAPEARLGDQAPTMKINENPRKTFENPRKPFDN